MEQRFPNYVQTAYQELCTPTGLCPEHILGSWALFFYFVFWAYVYYQVLVGESMEKASISKEKDYICKVCMT